jgi:seryl-tRNA synthetase
MHDIHAIKKDPDGFDAALARRGLAPVAEKLLVMDEARRKAISDIEALSARRNQVAKEIPARKKAGGDIQDLLDEGNAIKAKLADLQAQDGAADALNLALLEIPNLLSDDVPDGADEADNQQICVVGDAPVFDFKPKDHVALGEALSMMDFAMAAKMSGSRFVVLKNDLARLERALASFMLDLHTQEFGFSEMAVPFLVKEDALFGSGQLPKFADDLFHTTGDHSLIPTSEVPLVNSVAGDILDAANLPLRLTGCTPCFRSEAGSAGRDTRGMIRQHQFSKVELVAITAPEDSAAEHERITQCAQEVLKRLGLHYRMMLLCAGDTGFAAQKTYDLEVWLPAQNTFREISSCSNCGDFQARRMKARMRAKGEKETRFVHTLNGSGLAVGRTLVAVLENYQNADGSVRIPDVLQPYMGGQSVIRA